MDWQSRIAIKNCNVNCNTDSQSRIAINNCNLNCRAKPGELGTQIVDNPEEQEEFLMKAFGAGVDISSRKVKIHKHTQKEEEKLKNC